MWSKIVGHSRQIDELKRAISSVRIPNAYLFTGPGGIGKRMVANSVAAALVCQGSSGNPCGACAACHKVSSNSHPDVFVVEPESAQGEKTTKTDGGRAVKRSDAIKIEQIRELQSSLQFHPLEAKSKIAIIDDADRMTEASANSLLKILEEPPPETHFIIISTAPHLILPTIRSRARHVAFSPLKDAEVLKILAAAGTVGKTAQRIVKLSGGSPGRALSIDPEFAAAVISRLDALLMGATSADVIETAEGWSHSEPQQIHLIFELLSSWYRDCVRYSATGDLAPLIHDESAAYAQRVSYSKLERGTFEVETARRAMDTTANKQLLFEGLLFTLAAH